MDQGTVSLAQVAGLLLSSPEFLSDYPAASGAGVSARTAFVDQFYERLFDRPAGNGGTGHVAAIQGGGSEGQIALDVSRSLEACNDYLPYEGGPSLGALYRLYEAAFERAPDASGQATYATQLDRGASLQSIAVDLLGSSEFAATPGSGSDAAFVSQIYQGVLGRAPDAGGLNTWKATRPHSWVGSHVPADISNDSEARAHTAFATHDSWR